LKQGKALGSEDQGLGSGLYYEQKKKAELGALMCAIGMQHTFI
jgi:hypothetical protein